MLSELRLGQFSLNGDVVLQKTTLTDATSGTETDPEYQPDVLAGLGVAGPLPMHARFEMRGRYTGRQVCVNPDTSGQVELESVSRVDAEVSRAWRFRHGWTSQLEVAIGADNLGDEVIYDQCGLPQPGRTFRVQLRLR